MIKAVIFDLGKVLVDFDYTIAITKIAARSQMSLLELGRWVTQSPLMMEYETGLVTSEQFFKAICSACGFSGDFDEFGSFFGDIFAPIEPMVELHSALRRRGLPTYIFSNTNDLAIRHIRQNFPFFANFDGYVLSYEHRAMKPGAKLYEAVERTTGRKGAELLYVDDRPENIEAGAARGWQVILQETPEKTRAGLEQLGLLNHG